MKNTLFISDLHLDESRPHITRAFFQFLETTAKNAEALYILGDFFDAWIGDDDDQPLVQEVAEKLATLTQTGTQVFLMHGNRDFLLGETFARRCNATLLTDERCINLYGVKTLLLHGDSLCTADTEYMQYRNLVRTRAWQDQVLALPLSTRRAMAIESRNKSKNMNSLKADDILDVTPSEVEKVFQQYQVKRMIHGHTHRPARHPMIVEGKNCERIVLGDWHDSFWYINASENDCQLIEQKI